VLKVHASRARWLFRFTNPAGVRHAIGLGVAHRDSIAAAGKSLTTAREAADKARKLLQDGTDPIDAKRQAREKARKAADEKNAGASHRSLLTQPEPGLQRNPESVVVTAAL
jgi:hypothetical protein